MTNRVGLDVHSQNLCVGLADYFVAFKYDLYVIAQLSVCPS